jgi:hypothetical protein
MPDRGGQWTNPHHVDEDVKAAERARQLLVALHQHPDGAADAAVHQLRRHDCAGVAAIVDLRISSAVYMQQARQCDFEYMQSVAEDEAARATSIVVSSWDADRLPDYGSTVEMPAATHLLWGDHGVGCCRRGRLSLAGG